MFDQIPLDDDTLYSNPEPRCPVVLLLDSSGSMSGERINLLNQALRTFGDDLRDDSLAMKRCEIATVTFGERVEVVSDFASAEAFRHLTIIPNGQTPMGGAVHKAIDMLDARKAQYRNAGLKYYRPWIFLLTDGQPTDRWEDAARRAREGEEKSQFAFFAFAVEGANMDTLQQFSSKRPPQKLRGNNFREMFLWLSSSLKSVSRSTPGMAISLQKPSDEWTI
ncbi:vWA domain-containing protein [Deinococcus hopiensis]|uniref:Uncharacterized conserved protein YegL, contains vWA domain of TerY type n=1 Tax=Deinococcus hopiensis KR-140 TaxID=695939 RepID=A0A1W1UJR2_9DEIO|nr:VWA domain-containing protein [Deinococcus hopiensis]SMB81320.1 Uncharacterized conserved protein YegL, contains vWA domain of TerY type [Deinococcus hopiensis KR-140]